MELSKNLSIVLINAFLALLTFLIGTVFVVNKLTLKGIGACIIGILVIVWFNLRQTHYKPINAFYSLNLEALKGQAFVWGNTYKYLRKIILYRAPSERGRKYVLFFDFDTSTVKGQNSKGTFDGHTWSNEYYPLDDSFMEVYKHPPLNEFFREWLITTESPQKLNKRLSMVLYDKKST